MKHELRVCLATTKHCTFFGSFASLGHHSNPIKPIIVNLYQIAKTFIMSENWYDQIDHNYHQKLLPNFKVSIGLVNKIFWSKSHRDNFLKFASNLVVYALKTKIKSLVKKLLGL